MENIYYYETKRDERKISIKQMWEDAKKYVKCSKKMEEIKLNIIKIFELTLEEEAS